MPVPSALVHCYFLCTFFKINISAYFACSLLSLSNLSNFSRVFLYSNILSLSYKTSIRKFFILIDQPKMEGVPPQGYVTGGYQPPQSGYPQPGYSQPGYPQPGYPSQPSVVVVTQPSVSMVGALALSPTPMTITCPNCRQTVSTTVSYDMGLLAWLICLLLCLFGCVCSYSRPHFLFFLTLYISIESFNKVIRK